VRKRERDIMYSERDNCFIRRISNSHSLKEGNYYTYQLKRIIKIEKIENTTNSKHLTTNDPIKMDILFLSGNLKKIQY